MIHFSFVVWASHYVVPCFGGSYHVQNALIFPFFVRIFYILVNQLFSFQLISLDSIMSSPGHGAKRTNDIKSLAFSVFSQSHYIQSYQSSVKSLTGFGPAAVQSLFLKNNSVSQFYMHLNIIQSGIFSGGIHTLKHFLNLTRKNLQ